MPSTIFQMKRLLTCCALTFILAFSGCQQTPTKESLSDTFEGLRETLDPAAISGEKIQDMATQEFEKLFTLEYRVVDMDSSLSGDQQEALLMQLGRDRWDCFHITPQEFGLRVFCKRQPKSYLRYAKGLL
jgi:hypothetical protein